MCIKILIILFLLEIAISPNSNEVHIYQKKEKEWIKIHELTEHSGRITGKTKENSCHISH